MQGLKQSPWIVHYDASSCNGCDIETLACLTPLYDVERLGVINTGNPKHADIFLVTGAVNEQSMSVIANIYRQLPEPNVVIAVGACASSGGIFRDCYNIRGGVDTIVPVDVYQPGCPPRPEAIIDAVVKGLAALEEKHLLLAAATNGMDQVLYAPAERRNAPEILALRKAALQADAFFYNDDSFPALQQSLADLDKEFDTKLFIKACVNGKIIGAAAGCQHGDTTSIDGLAVHPYFRDRGVAGKLLEGIEQGLPAAKRFEAYAGHRSEALLRELAGCGYQPFRTEKLSPGIDWVHVQKERP